MLKKMFCGFAILLLLGCASTKSHTVGGYSNNMETGLSVYHQYISTILSVDKNGKLVQSKRLLESDENKDIPSNVVRLDLTLLIQNPYKRYFEIWENLKIQNIETNEVYLKHKKLRQTSQLLPEEQVSIGMPLILDVHSQVIFSVDLKDKSGNTLYSTYTAKYKVGSNNN